MTKDVTHSRQLLKDIDEKYKADPEVPKMVENYRKKYSSLKVKNLRKTITI